ncbi:tRNA 2-thiouridine(34) synthase MnmA [Haliovirga abyssi]|uniref:tRNA-specific 2-thiouridylase MnmA n=1 Tax=Haliovirga abyssi TaxID=2996794 RepID=A0AAU9DHP5_9FUSO|nr:tRNA 2-thiouridine(34) synthase MnmA [Haliovirga abyssi]BDU50264.1 tRNA-specific 2-thiouridylase MnmA 1 [Haliovirga abyssi]
MDKIINKNKTIAVAMSGGVDSSVVAYMLKKEGYNIIGITMKHWGGEDSGDNNKTCCSLDDIYDAKRVCDDLGISHYVVNFEKEFKEEVVKYFIDDYINGNTPNPCVVCNRKIKLGKLVDFSKKIGADFLATGHYAKVINEKLYMGDDVKKDQAYFLSQVKKDYFKSILFPIGNYNKTYVRELAKELGVRVYAKKDSQEICFVENDDYKKFLMNMTDGKIFKNGEIVTTKGEVVGKHKGTAFYTIGQRKGLGISYSKPLYVVDLDSKNNRVIVGDNEELFRNKLIAIKINLLGVEKIEELDNIYCNIKTRSRDILHRAKLKLIDENKIEASFELGVRAITPGQLAVFYREDGLVLGSGFIEGGKSL